VGIKFKESKKGGKRIEEEGGENLISQILEEKEIPLDCREKGGLTCREEQWGRVTS